MAIKISTPTFLEIQSQLADWLMSSELGDDGYSEMVEMKNNDRVLVYTDEGQDIFNNYYDDVESFLLKYFEKED
jgi:hypothetical protein|tara:strand:+ start:610 stop:831 length:222 start_codon:yes stop_codon:yes gene_type:complete